MERPRADDVFLSRLRQMRRRYVAIFAWFVAIGAVLAVFASVEEIGAFAYYVLLGLAGSGALLSLVQSRRIVLPIAAIIKRIQDVSEKVERGDANELRRVAYDGNDEFSYLAAEVDSLVEKFAARIAAQGERVKRCEEIIDAFPFTVVIVSRSGKAVDVIQQNNEPPLRSFVVGQRPLAKYWGATNLATYDRELAKVFAGDNVGWVECYVPRDDKPHHFRISITRLNPFFAMLCVRDVTERDEWFVREHNLIQQREHAARNSALMRMAASIGHDGKNIFAILENLLSLHVEAPDPKVREEVAIAADAIKRGNKMMKELMEYAGDEKFVMRRVPAAETFRATVENPALRGLLTPKVKLEISVSDKPMPDLDLDVGQAWKIPFNLTKNAVEAMGEGGGVVKLSARPFEMTPEAAAGFISAAPLAPGMGALFTIADDGPGMPKKMLEHVFDPYYSSKGVGRGLGLSTVRTIIDAHGGGVRVKSDVGEGMTFEFFLPESKRSREEAEMMRKAAPGGEMLLVDDDPMILRTTSLLLRTMKIAAHPAGTADDALRTFRSLSLRLRAVLLDAHVQGETSVTILRQMRQTNPDVPVVVVSGSTESQIREIFAGERIDGFLEKPYSVDDVRRIFAELPPPPPEGE